MQAANTSPSISSAPSFFSIVSAASISTYTPHFAVPTPFASSPSRPLPLVPSSTNPSHPFSASSSASSPDSNSNKRPPHDATESTRPKRAKRAASVTNRCPPSNPRSTLSSGPTQPLPARPPTSLDPVRILCGADPLPSLPAPQPVPSQPLIKKKGKEPVSNSHDSSAHSSSDINEIKSRLQHVDWGDVDTSLYHAHDSLQQDIISTLHHTQDELYDEIYRVQDDVHRVEDNLLDEVSVMRAELNRLDSKLDNIIHMLHRPSPSSPSPHTPSSLHTPPSLQKTPSPPTSPVSTSSHRRSDQWLRQCSGHASPLHHLRSPSVTPPRSSNISPAPLFSIPPPPSLFDRIDKTPDGHHNASDDNSMSSTSAKTHLPSMTPYESSTLVCLRSRVPNDLLPNNEVLAWVEDIHSFASPATLPLPNHIITCPAYTHSLLFLSTISDAQTFVSLWNCPASSFPILSDIHAYFSSVDGSDRVD
ncbi:hypothetical protein D9758_017988 [Tetrapyrgos nigripes]|uniref:Uncharacterized protein n=1 Tax=Tetrapyrgos nigripes TaxID=182062 RepID=A0A8H5BTJ4_9AGAR|nr:hypothetical protein D9758_017988 [Tetrapyrgos nigripes]